MDIDQAIIAFTSHEAYAESRATILAILGHYPSFLLAIRERHRMVDSLGFTPAFAATLQNRMELSRGAFCFLKQALLMGTMGAGAGHGKPFQEWPWPAETWRPPITKEEAIVKAMAFLGAELDRIILARAEESAAAEETTAYGIFRNGRLEPVQ